MSSTPFACRAQRAQCDDEGVVVRQQMPLDAPALAKTTVGAGNCSS